jgi:hypothetical protein
VPAFAVRYEVTGVALGRQPGQESFEKLDYELAEANKGKGGTKGAGK